MSSDPKLRIICYDVSCDRRRRRIARLLEQTATRVQLSVFEARLSPSALRRLVDSTACLLEQGDSLRVYTIGRAGERHCSVHGSGVPIDAVSGYWLF